MHSQFLNWFFFFFWIQHLQECTSFPINVREEFQHENNSHFTCRNARTSELVCRINHQLQAVHMASVLRILKLFHGSTLEYTAHLPPEIYCNILTTYGSLSIIIVIWNISFFFPLVEWYLGNKERHNHGISLPFWIWKTLEILCHFFGRFCVQQLKAKEEINILFRSIKNNFWDNFRGH